MMPFIGEAVARRLVAARQVRAGIAVSARRELPVQRRRAARSSRYRVRRAARPTVAVRALFAQPPPPSLRPHRWWVQGQLVARRVRRAPLRYGGALRGEG